MRENVFVICKTPMAKQITRRTLAGYRDIPVNAHYFDDLINMMKNKPRQFVDRVLKPSYWKQEGVKTMKFDAVVGNEAVICGLTPEKACNIKEFAA